MKFLLQAEFKNEAFITLQRAQDYHYWKNGGKETFITATTGNIDEWTLKEIEEFPKEWCPVGSVEFVHNYYKEHFGLELKPINVPEQLFPFAGRTIVNNNLPQKYVSFTGTGFVKSNDIEKWKGNDVYNLIDFNRGDLFPKGNYQISEIIDIHAEYRCFVYQGQLLGIHFYQGDFFTIPYGKTILEMIEAYTNSPTAYTLDVAVTKIDGGYHGAVTSVLEVHDFYACGLYGFQDLEKLPFMYWRSHLDKVNRLE